VTSTYNGASRVSGITNSVAPTTFVSGAHYNALGERTTQTLGNGLTETWTYDNRGRVASYALKNGSTTDYSYSLSYYPNGNVMTANDSFNGNWAYGYDDLNRMTSANVTGQTHFGSIDFTYAYDRFGNRWQQNVTLGSGPTSSLAFDANNHIIGSGITYDGAGNVTDDGTNTYTYDPEERIATVPSQSASFYYDGDGNRGVIYATACNVCQFPYWYRIYDLQDQEIARCSFTFSCGPNEYREGNRQLFNAGFGLFEHPDWLGTERYLTETNASQYGYCVSDPYGDGLWCPENDGDTTNIHFVGRELDNANEESPDLLYNFGARYYAYWLGRFMSPDSPFADQDSGDPQSWNLYSYARNNPATNVDRDGRACVQQSDGSWKDDNSGGQSCADANADNDTGGYRVTVDGTTPEEKKSIQTGETKQLISDLTFGILQPIARNQWQALGIQRQARADAITMGLPGPMALAAEGEEFTGLLPMLKGAAGEQRMIADITAEGGTILGTHVSIDTSQGRIVADAIYTDASGNLVIGEAKNGPTADYNTNQLAHGYGQGGPISGVVAGTKGGSRLAAGAPIVNAPVRTFWY
jgi:RHS repeat-associated protein